VLCGDDAMVERAPQTNLEIIWADWVDAIRRGDIDRLASRITPTTVHRGIHPELICQNGSEVIDNARSSSENLPRVDAIELIESGDHVVVGIHAAGIAPDGHDHVFIVFTLRRGAILEIRDYLDRGDALAAAGATESPSRR
jgi:ketosteroid isomerase-like protein